jgi:DNA polymerase-3 subunit chi
VTETLFYHLERRTMEEVLPELLERTLAKDWRALVCCDSADRVEALDSLLWTYRDDSFLPHAGAGDGAARDQPILISTDMELANQPHVLFLVGGQMPVWDSPQLAGLSRIVVLFDGSDSTMITAARAAWKAATAAGHAVTYWRQNATGKWQKQA